MSLHNKHTLAIALSNFAEMLRIFCHSPPSFCLVSEKILFFPFSYSFYVSITLFSLFWLLLVRAEEQHEHFPTALTNYTSPSCFNHSQIYLQAYLNEERWASKMYRATGLLSVEGLKNKDTFTSSPGLFDECLAIDTPYSFRGQFCSVFFQIGPAMPAMGIENHKKVIREQDGDENTFYLPRVGFCLPSSCNSLDFRSSVRQLITKKALASNITSSIAIITDENYCYNWGNIALDPEFDGPDIAVLTILCLLALLVLNATIYDGWRLLTNNSTIDCNWKKFLNCFSALENGRKLLSTEVTPFDLSCLHGIRALSATWIILHHAYRFFDFSPTNNTFGPERQDLYEWGMQAYTRGAISVDTFFMMSGLLVSYSLLRDLQRNEGRFNIFLFYLHRYIRITPFYYLWVGFIATLSVYLGAGPLWHFVRQMSQSCRLKWWTHFLYINNFFTTSDCVTPSWYLAADMQLFVLSPLFVYPLWKWKRVGVAWITFVVLAVLVAMTAIFVLWSLPATFFDLETPIEARASYWSWYHYQTWGRLPQYLTGILLGWIIVKYKKTTLKMSLIVFGWIGSLATILVVMYGLVPFLGEELINGMNPGFRVAYGVLHRFVWAGVVGWVVFACVNGCAGFVNTLLSWKGFIPLGRLSYVVYLIHNDYIKIYYMGLSRTPFYYTKLNAVMMYLAVVMVSFMLAFFLSVTIEMPFINLDRTFLNRKSQTKSCQSNERR